MARWARGFLPPDELIGTFDLLTQLSQAIDPLFRYRRREAKGVRAAGRRTGSAMVAAAISPC